MKSDRMVMSTRTFSSRRRSASSKICTNCVASSRACVSPNSRAALAEAGEAEAKQFLELVNDQQQSPAVETVRFGERLTQAETRLTQPILDTVAAPGRFVGAVSPGKARKRLGEARQRRGSRAHIETDPVWPAWVLALLCEQPAQAGEDQRRFSAARTSDDSDEPSVLDQPIQRKSLTLTAEEIVSIGVAEGPQAGKGPLRRQRGLVAFTRHRRKTGERGQRRLDDDVHGPGPEECGARSASSSGVGDPLSTRSRTLSNWPS